jgi:hypothetical protein
MAYCLNQHILHCQVHLSCPVWIPPRKTTLHGRGVS